MAWSTPATWVAGAVLTAAQLNAQLRDNLNAAFPLGAPDVAWTGYTPTLTQSGAVSKTVTYGKYTRVGRTITAQVYLTLTGAGTGANPVLVGLPVAAAGAVGLVIGAGWVADASAGTVYKGIVEILTSTTVQMRGAGSTANTDVLGASGVFTAALASGDLVTMTVTYESSS